MRTARPQVRLRSVVQGDIAIFRGFHSDSEAARLAAFASAEPPEAAAFAKKWAELLADPGTRNRTIVADGEVAGYIANFMQFGESSVSYWVGRAWWGRGVATSALAAFLADLDERPLYARVAKDNTGSLRVLETNGFKICGEDRGYAAARGAEVEEWILKLE